MPICKLDLCQKEGSTRTFMRMARVFRQQTRCQRQREGRRCSAHRIRAQPPRQTLDTIFAKQTNQASNGIRVIVSLLGLPDDVACHSDENDIWPHGSVGCKGSGKDLPAGLPATPPSPPATLAAANSCSVLGFPFFESWVFISS